MTVKIDIGSLQIREMDTPKLFEVSIDVTEGEAVNDWENTWQTVTTVANVNEPVSEILKRLRDDYVKKYKQSVAAEEMFTRIMTALTKDKEAREFDRQDPAPPKAPPMEVKIITEG